MTRRQVLLVVVTAFLLGLLALVGFLIYVNRVNASRVKQFKKSAAVNWARISDQAQEVNQSLSGVASTADFADVSKAAGRMQKLLTDIGRSLAEDPVPRGYQELSDDQKDAIKALRNYLEKVNELALEDDKDDFQKERGILESRARQASAAVNKFLSDAAYIRANMANDFYEAAAALDRGWQAPRYAGSAEAQVVYDAANAFMSADIKEANMDKVWSMVSSTRKAALSQLNMTREAVIGGWRTLWGGRNPVEYKLNSSSIEFPADNKATIKAVVDFKDSSPSAETIRLVKEDGVWRIETYPFVGWR